MTSCAVIPLAFESSTATILSPGKSIPSMGEPGRTSSTTGPLGVVSMATSRRPGGAVHVRRTMPSTVATDWATVSATVMQSAPVAPVFSEKTLHAMPSACESVSASLTRERAAAEGGRGGSSAAVLPATAPAPTPAPPWAGATSPTKRPDVAEPKVPASSSSSLSSSSSSSSRPFSPPRYSTSMSSSSATTTAPSSSGEPAPNSAGGGGDMTRSDPTALTETGDSDPTAPME
mmetsp:Transcript_40003/g.120565  ORF Transcript_40003/g.120565 Transcript_40003/m.120565 type:complete len:232 (+) Transcript_40003:373-1068(+)